MSVRKGALLLALALAASPLRAADKCHGKAILAGKPLLFKSCAVALYDDEGVTLLMTEAPLSPSELSTFEMNSYPPERDASGKQRAMISLAFCPGGGKQPTASPAAVKSVELSANDGSSPMGLQDVFELPAQKASFKIEKLSGELKAGGRLSGRITGSKTIEEKPNMWDLTFDVTLPVKAAAAGPGCGD
jgi:hypothetical protein